MNEVNYSDFHLDMDKYLDHVTKHNEMLMVSRKDGESVVIISLNDYNSVVETAHLNRSEANRKRLIEEIERSTNGEFKEYNLIEE